MVFALLPAAALAVAAFAAPAFGQTFQRLGTCPELGCIFPPTKAEFLAGVYFDVRIEIHAPHNGTEAFNNGVPDDNFSVTIDNGKGYSADITSFFQLAEPSIEHWNFTYYEDLFAQDAGAKTPVSVASKAYRQVALYEPGEYTVTLSYYNTQKTVAEWTVYEPCTNAEAKNVILFIGDGMPQSAITAARLIGHKSINGKYQSLMALDTMDSLGLQMTHSIDSFITDSANSATALYTGHKSTVNALGVYKDSSPDAFDDPKVETIAELFRRQRGEDAQIGIVSKAFLADATPVALVGHTPNRGLYAPLVEQYLHGLEKNFTTWPRVNPDVIMGGGAEQFIAGSGSPNKTDYYKAFQSEGYSVVYNNSQMQAASNTEKTLGVYSISNMNKWLDQQVFPENLRGRNDSSTGDKTDAIDQPTLAEMTLKTIDILHTRDTKDKGFFMMSEAASIDKMFHVLDYERALGELLELDDTVKQTIEHLEKLGIANETLIIVTADHGHGFDVFGSADTKYLKAAVGDRQKRRAVGVYAESGLSGYQVANGSLPNNQSILISEQGPGYPISWQPRYALAAGFAANPDHREEYDTITTGPRVPATAAVNSTDYYVNPKDQPDGFVVNGTLATVESQGVHSLTDITVYTKGPGHDVFRGVYNSNDIFLKMAKVMGLGTTTRA